MRIITLALTHFNRLDFLKKAIAGVIDDPRIAEVVISDDASADGSFAALKVHYASVPKVKFFRNERNLDCYRNKRAAVERSSNEWVILFDSDNVMDNGYLDAIYAIPEWDSDTAYCPEYAMPNFDFRAFSGVTITKENVASYMPKPNFATMLNAANYFVNRKSFLDVWDGSIDPVTADSILQAYNWLKSGKKMLVVPGLRYFHRVHDGSHYKQNCHRTGSIANYIEAKLLQLT